MEASGTAKPASWKSWPVVVIGIAVIAIVVAVVIMVWPQDRAAAANDKGLAPPPAPERMDTNPVAPGSGPSGQADPWKGGAAPDPAPAQPPAPPSVPDIDDIVPPSDVDDPLGGLGGSFRGNARTQSMLGMTTAVLKHACDRLAQCPNASDPTIKTMCELSGTFLPSAPAPTCQAAKRCLAKVDQLPCDSIDPNGGMTMGLDLMQTVPDCIEAMTRC